MHNEQSWPKGLLAALVTFSFFGLVLPILYDEYAHISSYRLLAWSVILALPALAIMIIALKKSADFKKILQSPRNMLLSIVGISGQGISSLAFIKGMALGRSLEVSLSYFVLPLFYVVVGVLFFKEKLSKLMAIALTLAILSLSYLFASQGEVSWILPVICAGAALYSTMRKITQLEPVSGLFWELLGMLPIALIYLLLSPIGFLPQNSGEWIGHTAIAFGNLVPMLMLVLCIRFLPFNAVGIVAWLAPTLTFLLSIFYWKTALDKTLLITFIGIWISMILYMIALKQDKKS